MVDFWEGFILHAAIGILAVVVKNPAKKAALYNQLMHIRDLLNQEFPPLSTPGK